MLFSFNSDELRRGGIHGKSRRTLSRRVTVTMYSQETKKQPHFAEKMKKNVYGNPCKTNCPFNNNVNKNNTV